MFPKMFQESDEQDSDYEDKTESSQQDCESLFKKSGYEDSNE